MSVLLTIDWLLIMASSLSASSWCVRVPDDHLRLLSNLSNAPPCDRPNEEPLQLTSAGTNRDMKARSVGRQAQTMPTFASIIDQRDASRNPVALTVSKFILDWNILLEHVLVHVRVNPWSVAWMSTVVNLTTVVAVTLWSISRRGEPLNR